MDIEDSKDLAWKYIRVDHNKTRQDEIEKNGASSSEVETNNNPTPRIQLMHSDISRVVDACSKNLKVVENRFNQLVSINSLFGNFSQNLISKAKEIFLFEQTLKVINGVNSNTSLGRTDGCIPIGCGLVKRADSMEDLQDCFNKMGNIGYKTLYGDQCKKLGYNTNVTITFFKECIHDKLDVEILGRLLSSAMLDSRDVNKMIIKGVDDSLKSITSSAQYRPNRLPSY